MKPDDLDLSKAMISSRHVHMRKRTEKNPVFPQQTFMIERKCCIQSRCHYCICLLETGRICQPMFHTLICIYLYAYCIYSCYTDDGRMRLQILSPHCSCASMYTNDTRKQLRPILQVLHSAPFYCWPWFLKWKIRQMFNIKTFNDISWKGFKKLVDWRSIVTN